MPGASAGIDWERATAECVEHLRALIRIPSVNPPGLADGAAGRDSTGGETAAAAYCAEVLAAAGIAAEVLESVPGRGSCFARLPATVRDPEPPIVLLSHVDVVPVDAEAWSRDPFAARAGRRRGLGSRRGRHEGHGRDGAVGDAGAAGPAGSGGAT